MKLLGRDSQLARLLEATCNQLSALDPQRDGPALMEQVQAARPDLKKKIDAALTAAKPEVAALVPRTIGAGMLSIMRKEVPELIDRLVARINDRSTEPALRCALVSVLGYVVQPRDIVPDDAPGGYGFVDDHALLVAITLQLTDATPANAPAIEELQKRLASLTSMLPMHVAPALQAAIQGTVLMFQSLRMLPPQAADSMTQMVLADPIGATAPQPPQAPPGWVPPNLSPPDRGRWSGGIYVEGNNVIVPGGPSLLDGQLYIPS